MISTGIPGVRYRLVQDQDAHWYLIPKHAYTLFLDWVEWMELQSERECAYIGPDFDGMRIDAPQDIDILDYEAQA